MSFITTIEADASAIEQDVVSGLKTAVSYVDNVLVTEILPEFGTAVVQALEKFGSELLTQLLGQLVGSGTATAPTSPPAPTA